MRSYDLWVLLYVASLMFEYEIRFTEATVIFGRSLSPPEFLKMTPTGFQDAITPPYSTKLAIAMYIFVVLIFGYGFYENGFLIGLISAVVFFVFVLVNRLFLIPKPDGEHFRKIILRSMINRHADYLKIGDNVRAGVMAEFLETAGISAAEFAQHFAKKK
jgi:hypothetical protein